MKLNRSTLKELIEEVLTNPEDSMLLESPVIESTAGSVASRVNLPDGYEIGDTGRIAKGFLFLSADRGELDQKVNDANYIKLKDIVKAAGFPFIKVEGGWVEKDKTTGVERPVVERSLIIWDEPRGSHAAPPSMPIKELGMQLSQLYNQEEFVYGFLTKDDHGGAHRTIKAYNPDGSERGWLDAHELHVVPEDAEFWSRIRHKGPKTQLKEDTIEIEAPNSVIEAMRKARAHKNKKIKFIRGKR
jgi:hypothetical protein